MKSRINKEALITLIIYVIYFLWWSYFAFIYPPKDPNQYTYILGMPSWFFYSCVLGFILFNILVFICTKYIFKEIDLETGDEIEY